MYDVSQFATVRSSVNLMVVSAQSTHQEMLLTA